MATRQKHYGRSSFWGVLGCAAIVVGVGIIAYPIFAVPQTTHDGPTPLSAIKQISLALTIYASDNDNIFPPAKSQADFQNQTNSYIKNQSLFEVGREDHSTSIQFNLHLANVRLSTIPDPSAIPTVWTPYSDKPNGPITKYFVTYADFGGVHTVLPNEGSKLFDGLDRFFPPVDKSLTPVEPAPGTSDPADPSSLTRKRK